MASIAIQRKSCENFVTGRGFDFVHGIMGQGDSFNFRLHHWEDT